MPHIIHLTDDGGKPAVQTVTIRTAKAKEVGLFFRSLGLAVSRQTGVDGRSLLTAKCTGLTLMIVPDQQPSDPTETTLNFAVDSLNSALDAAMSNHGQLAMKAFETQWGRRAIVADPDGRRLVITELRPEVEPEDDSALPTYGEPRTRSSRRDLGYDEEKALAAVKRGAIVILLGVVAQLLGALITLASTFSTLANHRGSRGAVNAALGDQMELFGMLVGLGLLAQIGGKVMCGIPATSRAGYAPLWSAIGLEATNIVLGVVNRLDPGFGLVIPTLIVLLMTLAAPFLFVLFIGNLMEETRNDSPAALAKTTNSVYGIMLAAGAAGLAFIYFSPQSILLAASLIGLVALIYTGFYITLLVKVLGAKVSKKGMR